jgi:hypothetical protein
VSGSLLDLHGIPSARAGRVVLFHPDGRRTGDIAEADAHGRFEFASLSAGDYQWWFVPPTGMGLPFPHGRGHLRVHEGAATRLDVPLPPGYLGRTIVDIACSDGFFQRQPDGEENAEVVVRLDDVVAWHNAGRQAHDIAGGPWRRAGPLAPGQSFVWIATQAGRFRYQCTRTPGMSAVVRVEPSNA